METTLYDSSGRLRVYIADSDGAIYTWNGNAVAYIDGETIYGWRGKHLGWFVGGILYDLHGHRVGFTRGTCPVATYAEPAKYAKYAQYAKYARYAAYARPAFSLGSSQQDLEAFVSQDAP